MRICIRCCLVDPFPAEVREGGIATISIRAITLEAVIIVDIGGIETVSSHISIGCRAADNAIMHLVALGVQMGQSGAGAVSLSSLFRAVAKGLDRTLAGEVPGCSRLTRGVMYFPRIGCVGAVRVSSCAYVLNAVWRLGPWCRHAGRVPIVSPLVILA